MNLTPGQQGLKMKIPTRLLPSLPHSVGGWQANNEGGQVKSV